MVKAISWDLEARKFFKKSIIYIKQDSEVNAETVRKGILQAIAELKHHPTKYSPDQYRKNNDGSYRAFEICNFRIAYFISEEHIRIVRMRHVKMEPKSY